MGNDYDGIGIYTLGELATDNIAAYAKTRDQRNLAKIFPLLIEMGSRTIFTRYHNRELFALDDAIQQIAEDVLIVISKEPERFLCINNFYPYYRRTVLVRTSAILKEFYESWKDRDSVDEYSSEARNELIYRFDIPIDVLAKKDDYSYLIRKIHSKLKSCPRFNKSAQYLIWPMLVSILYQENQLFDSLDFRDRIGLRAIRNKLTREKYLYA